MAPLDHLQSDRGPRSNAPSLGPRGLGDMFNAALRRENQLISCDPTTDTYLASALLLRGDVQVSDVQRHIGKIRSKMRFIFWNSDGFKIGLCGMPSNDTPFSMLALANNCCVRDTFKRLRGRFVKLYRARAHLHHYTEHMDASHIDLARDRIDNLIENYASLSKVQRPTELKRLHPLF